MNVKDIKTALPGYFTTTEAADALGYVSGDYLRQMCQQGKIPAYKAGKTWFLTVEQVQALADRETGNRGGRGQKRT